MSNEITLASDFAVARTSKAGKTTYRGALGVISSGNSTERAKLTSAVVVNMIANNNYKHLMKEVTRVFPTSAVKKCPGVLFMKAAGERPEQLWFEVSNVDGKAEFEIFDGARITKAVAHLYAKAVLAAVAGKELKGEKLTYATALADMLDAEAARLAAPAAAEVAA